MLPGATVLAVGKACNACVDSVIGVPGWINNDGGFMHHNVRVEEYEGLGWGLQVRGGLIPVTNTVM